MASATGTSRAAALLFSFSAVVLFLLRLPPPGLAVADLLVSALDRLLDGRGGLLELATRRNMILLCHAILFLILRDAGVLGAPARRRSHSGCPPGEATSAVAVAASGTEIACSAAPIPAPAPAPARPHATRSAVIWRRRPRNRAVDRVSMHEHDAAGRVVVECRPAIEAVATWAEEAAAVATKQIVLVESPRNDDDDMLDHHDRAAVVEPLEHPTTAIAADGERDDCDDRRIIAAADDDDKRIDDTAREQQTAGMEMEMEMELADDRTFEEFIESQRRQMRQESLQLVRVSSGYHYQAIASCY